MASLKLFGCEAEEEVGGGSSIAREGSRSGIQSDGEAMSLSVCFPPSNLRESGDCNPYFRFPDSNPDIGSATMDSQSDLQKSFIDFFYRETYEVDSVGEFVFMSPSQRVSTSDDFNIFGLDDTEEEIELGLGIGSGSGQLGGDSGGEVTGNGEIESGTSLESVVEEALVTDEELEWDDLQNAISWVQEGELSLASRDDDDDDDQEDQLDLHWQFLLSVYNVEESEDIMADYNLMDIEYDENHGDYNVVFDNEAGIMASPPASKKVVDDLPVVEISSEELSNGNIACAICKDEIMVEEKVKKLPCRHYYHGECIIPWLGIRNTCPVCRYELPTDNLEYERNRRSQRPGRATVW